MVLLAGAGEIAHALDVISQAHPSLVDLALLVLPYIARLGKWQGSCTIITHCFCLVFSARSWILPLLVTTKQVNIVLVV